MRLQVYREVAQLRSVLDKHRREHKTVAMVATMGNLHAGHIALVKQAKSMADIVVATIFVNPLQFGLNEDWDKYPRTFESDFEQLNQASCNYLFFPTEEQMYPQGMQQQTRVFCPEVTDKLCGASRPGHFEGVTTVVTKLTHIVDPDIAVYGEKDWQQLVIIKKMSADLCMRVNVVGAPIERDFDGLALSSRNSFIEKSERLKANQLNLSLNWAKGEIKAGNSDYQRIETQAKQQINEAGFRVDYFRVCQAETLQFATENDTYIAILGAMYTQAARLIDNVQLHLNNGK